jgi:hypothetical protein
VPSSFTRTGGVVGRFGASAVWPPDGGTAMLDRHATVAEQIRELIGKLRNGFRLASGKQTRESTCLRCGGAGEMG